MLENENIYISPYMPKVIAWRLLIRLEDSESLNKMNNLLYLTYESLIKDESFCAVFEVNYLYFFD